MDTNDHKISEEKVSLLMSKLKNDKNLAKKLGLLEDEPHVNENPKRKSFISPLRVKKVRKTSDGSFVNFDEGTSTAAGLSDENALVNETSISGTSHNLSSQTQNDSESESEANSETEVDDLENLENILCKSDDEDHDDHNISDVDDGEEYDILGGPSKSSWSPSKKALSFYLKAADIDLGKDLLNEIQQKYKSDEKLNDHFSPPRFPASLWSTVQSSQSDTFRLKSLFKVQDNLYLAVKPLLDCLDTADKESKPKILQSIQLICSSNLQLNRFRRATIAPHLKPELRKQVLALPVTHNSFFGEDFSKAADNLIKEQSAMEKVIHKKSFSSKPAPYAKPSTSQGYSSYNNQNYADKKLFRGGRSRGRFTQNHRGRGRRGFGSYNRGGNNYPSSSTGGNPNKQF